MSFDDCNFQKKVMFGRVRTNYRLPGAFTLGITLQTTSVSSVEHHTRTRPGVLEVLYARDAIPEGYGYIIFTTCVSSVRPVPQYPELQ